MIPEIKPEDIFRTVDSFTMDPLDLTTLHERAVEIGCLIFLQSGGCPMLWLVGRSRTGVVTVMETRTRNETEKQVMLGVMRRGMQRFGCDLYSHISEAWIAKIEPETDPALRDLTPSEREDRTEALIISTCDRNGPGRFTRFVITPQPIGPPLLGERDDGHGYTDFKGRMTSLLEEGE